MNVQLFKVLSDPTRMKILDYIKNNPNSVCCDIAKHIRKDASTTCRHIEALKAVGLIETRKNGKYLSCSLKNPKKIENLMKIADSLG